MSPATWGIVEHDEPIILVQRHPASHASPRRSPADRKSRTGRLKRLPSTISLALVVFTSGLALFDLYLLASSGIH